MSPTETTAPSGCEKDTATANRLAGAGADRRRELLRTLAERREQQNQTQTAVAAAIATSQSFVARLESTAADARVSTVERYAGSRGCVVQYHLVPLDQSADEPAVVVHESSSVSKGV